MARPAFKTVDLLVSNVCVPEYNRVGDDVRTKEVTCNEANPSDTFRITAVRPIFHRRFRRGTVELEANPRTCQVYLEHRGRAQWVVLKVFDRVDVLEKETKWLLRLADRGVRVPAVYYLGWITRDQRAVLLPLLEIMPSQNKFMCIFMERFSFQLGDDLAQLGVPDPHLPYAIQEVESNFSEALENKEDARLLAEGLYIYYILESVLKALIVLDTWTEGTSYAHPDVRAKNVVFSIEDKVDAALIDYEDTKQYAWNLNIAEKPAEEILGELLGDLFEAANRQRRIDSSMLPRWMRDVRYMDSVLEIVLFALDRKRGLEPEDSPRDADIML